MITAQALRKSYGEKTAVNGIDFNILPGKVTGFLGPNGAGKSTTMRMVMGLDKPTSGNVTVNGKPYAQHRAPLQEIGALLDAKAVHTGRSAYNHLLAIAATHGIGRKRVQEVIDIAGLTSVAKKRVGGFSLGMGQRLGIASAILGDPEILILDEPVNGLDPDGVIWVRNFVKQYAAEGRTVFLSSHLMSEMAQTADRLIIIGKGTIIADAEMDEVIRSSTTATVRVRTPDVAKLSKVLAQPNIQILNNTTGSLDITGIGSNAIGELAAQNGIVLHELTPQKASLEDAYLALTQDSVEYKTGEEK